MKRLALVLAAALLGTGCIVVDDDDCTGTLSLQWDFQRADGSVPGGRVDQICLAAGVAYVDVWMDGQPVGQFFCTDGGATILDVERRTYLVTVEGIDATGAIRYRHEFDHDGRSCGDPLLAVRPAAGFVNLDYALPGGVCGASPSFMYFAIRDDITGRLVPNAVALNPSACGPDIVPALAAGPYTLEWMEERASNGAILGRDCTARAVDAFGGETVTYDVVIENATVACPHPAP